MRKYTIPHFEAIWKYTDRSAENLIAELRSRNPRKHLPQAGWLSSVMAVAYMTGYRAAQRKARAKRREATGA